MCKIAYSFVSKKAHSVIKSLRVETLSTSVELKKSLEIRWTTKDYGSTSFNLKLSENDEESDSDEEPEEIPKNKNDDEEIKTMQDLPSRVEVFTKGRSFGSEYFEWSNQGMSYEQWIQHLLSIFHRESPIEMEVYLGKAKLVIPSFQNTFPKIRKILLTRNYNRLTDQDVLYAENLLKVFLPLVEDAHLDGVPLRKDFFVQNIGIVNLKELYIQSGQNLVLDDLLTLNVEILKVDDANQISLRDLNRFFKLWIKGSFPNLKEFLITKRTGIFPDWNVLLKGLRAEEPDAFKIFNTRKAPQVQVLEAEPEDEPEEEPEEDSEHEKEELEDVQEEEEEAEAEDQKESEDPKIEETEEEVEEPEAELEEESEGVQEVDEVEEEPEEAKPEEEREDEQEEDEESQEEESEPESDSEDEREELEDEEGDEDEVEWVEQPEEEPPGPTSMNVKIRNCHGVCADIQLQYISGMICYVKFFIRDPNETYAIWY
ncbi:unnamed protein product [Caenorhabditis nigoni]